MKSRKIMVIIIIVLSVLLIVECYNNKNNIFVQALKVITAKKPVEEQHEVREQMDEPHLSNKQTNEAPFETKGQTGDGNQETILEAEEPTLNETMDNNNEDQTTYSTETETETESLVSTTDSINVLPDSIMNTVEYYQNLYPNMAIGVGLYSLDGTTGYEYNSSTQINSACTIKAAYALYVLQEAERRGIDIWYTYLTYQEWHSDPDGSGDIQLYASYGAQYSIAELVRLLLQVSDNVAYNMLLDEFSLNDFYAYNSAIGGQCDWSKWGTASVQQRKNEWVAIWNYVNSDAWYSQVLRTDLTGTQYAYFLQGMQNWHNYMQKSGWTEEDPDYPATCEAAIIDDSYILIVLTQDYTYDEGHIDVLQGIGAAVESFWYANNGVIF